MKLKRSFWAKTVLISGLTLLVFSSISCVTNNITVPVPGQGSVKINNIYVEYYNIAESYYKLEDYKRASEYYELSMHKRSQYWAAYYKLAKCYIFSSEWDKALPMYKKILERDPENTAIKASLAYIYSMQGNFKQSTKIYEELLEANPNSQEHLENYLAVLLADEKKFEKKNAVKFVNTYETLKTEYPDNKNLSTFEGKYKELMNIVEEEGEDSEDNTEEESESESESENQGEGEAASEDAEN